MPESTTADGAIPSTIRKRRWPKAVAGTVLFLALAFWGLWNIDMARQTIKITYLGWVGGLWKLHGRVERHMVYSQALHQERQVLVYLPPGYDVAARAGKRFPALYLLHGFPDPGDGWERFGLAPQLIDQDVVEGRLPPMLLILPDCHNSQLGKFGDSEYMDSPAASDQPGTKVASFVTGDLSKWVDKQFRTVPSADGRIVAGLSTGAYGAANLGLQRPDVFGTVIALSGYYEVDLRHFGRPLWGAVPDPARMKRESPLDYLHQDPKWGRTYVFIGDGYKDYDDVKEQSSRLDAALTRAGIAHVYHHLYGHHSWDMWRAMLVEALRTVAPQVESRIRIGGKSEAVK